MTAVAEIELVEGDITDQHVDVIVNAANPSLLGGGGVDGAIHRRGGPEILAECRALRADQYPDGLPVGDAVATTAGLLRARWVVHTVGPVYSSTEDRSHLLAACYRNALRCAAELGASTVAFPAISTGVFRWPLASAAEIAIGTTTAAGVEHPTIRVVRFVLWGHDALAAFRAASGRE